MNLSSTSRIPILDTVRGFAAFWVLLSHSFAQALIIEKVPLLGDGRGGVDVFMILSGYLMFYLYSNINSREKIVRFFLARFFRISPVYYLFLVLSAVFIFGLTKAGAASLFFRITYLFGFIASPPESGMPDWSIALEMQFYAAFPLLGLFWRRKGWFPVVLVSTIGSIMFHLLWSVYSINSSALLGNFEQPTLLPFKLPMFLLGGFLADPLFFQNKTKARLIIALNLVGVIFPALMMTGYKISVVIYLACLGCVFCWRSELAQVRTILKIFDVFLTARIFRFAGDVSYSVYLLHGFVLCFVSGWMKTNGMWEGAGPVFRLGSLLLVSLPLIYSLSWLIWLSVETQCIQVGKNIAMVLFPPKRVLAPQVDKGTI